GDAAAKLSDNSAWTNVKASTSNDKAVAVSAAPGASATSLSIEVQQLAKAQSAASSAFGLQSSLGAGTLSFQVGSGDVGNVEIEAGKDSLAEVAQKINESKAGVTATVLRDASGERLLMRAADTGTTNSFTVTVTGGDPGGLEGLAFGNGAVGGMTET